MALFKYIERIGERQCDLRDECTPDSIYVFLFASFRVFRGPPIGPFAPGTRPFTCIARWLISMPQYVFIRPKYLLPRPACRRCAITAHCARVTWLLLSREL